jgi:hypothetical protein
MKMAMAETPVNDFKYSNGFSLTIHEGISASRAACFSSSSSLRLCTFEIRGKNAPTKSQ